MLANLFYGYDLGSFFLMMLYRVPAIMIAIAVHESAHAYSAYRLGDPTARNLGRVTMNPLKHLDVAGTIMLLLVGFGWAKPVPVNPRNFRNPRKDDIIVSLAGVVANLVTAFVFLGIWYFFIYTIGFANNILNNFMSAIVLINIYLAIFNLIPIPPLDGYHVLKSAVRIKNPKFFWVFERYGFLILIVLLFTGAVSATLGFVGRSIFSAFDAFYQLIF